MTEARFAETDNMLTMSVSGHAGFAELGEDIVCAGASMLGHALVYGLGGVPGIRLTATKEGPVLGVSCTKTPETHGMFLMAWAGYRSLAENFPKNVCVRGEISAID